MDSSAKRIFGLMSNVTVILQKIASGDGNASRDLLPLVYDELRQLASRELSREGAGHTLQPTALVHDAYVRLVDQDVEPQWSHRGHFYSAAAEAMRRILVENARRKQTLKRGGDRKRVPLAEAHVPARELHPDIVALDQALTELAEQRPEVAQLVSLRYFAGLTVDQAAKALDISPRTAARNWRTRKPSCSKRWTAGSNVAITLRVMKLRAHCVSVYG